MTEEDTYYVLKGYKKLTKEYFFNKEGKFHWDVFTPRFGTSHVVYRIPAFPYYIVTTNGSYFEFPAYYKAEMNVFGYYFGIMDPHMMK